MRVRDPVQVVVRDLHAEFDGYLSDETISALATDAVRAFEDPAVREFVPTLAWRRARRRAWGLAWSGKTPVPRPSDREG
jgi:hypothetical protein